MKPSTTRPARRVGAGVSRRGFASMDAERKQLVASSGGKASHAGGKGHNWTSEEARLAGRKGGTISRRGPTKAV